MSVTRNKQRVGGKGSDTPGGEEKESATKDRTYASSTLEDIRIFEEWLRSSSKTISLSRLLHQGLMFLVLCYTTWATIHGFAWLMYNDKRPTWFQLVYRFHAVILAGVWLLALWSGGGYHRRVQHVHRLNVLLEKFQVCFCGESGRLRILRKNMGPDEEAVAN